MEAAHRSDSMVREDSDPPGARLSSWPRRCGTFVRKDPEPA
jgi:hypothetical protein